MKEQRTKVDPVPEIGFCDYKMRLMGQYLDAIRELVALHDAQTRSVIDGDKDFPRFDVLIHMAHQLKDERKYSLIAHMDAHHC